MPGRYEGNATRRRILKAGLAVAGGAVAASRGHAMDDAAAGNKAAEQSPAAKFTPEEVHYQASPNNGWKCVFCSYFKAPNTCWILTEPVSSQGWCDHFALLHE